MNDLINTLRLQTALFNNFLIENYLVSVNNKDTCEEPHKYLFNSFYKLSGSIASLGSIFGNINEIQNEDLVNLKQAIIDASTITYLIEKSSGLDDLAVNIKRINTYNLSTSIQNINRYGEEFNKNKTEIESEINELRNDNAEYFGNDGSFKFDTYNLSLEEAVVYLSTYSSVTEVRNSFKNITDTFQYCSSIIAKGEKCGVDYASDKTFLVALLNTLTVLLIAIGYLEPFFEKSDDIALFFEQEIKKTTSIQGDLLGNL